MGKQGTMSSAHALFNLCVPIALIPLTMIIVLHKTMCSMHACLYSCSDKESALVVPTCDVPRCLLLFVSVSRRPRIDHVTGAGRCAVEVDEHCVVTSTSDLRCTVGRTIIGYCVELVVLVR